MIYDGKPEFAPYITGAVIGNLIASVFFGFIIGKFLGSTLLAVVGGVIILIILTILSIMAYTRTHYAITDKRAIVQSGIIGRDFKSIDYDKMQNSSLYEVLKTLHAQLSARKEELG